MKGRCVLDQINTTVTTPEAPTAPAAAPVQTAQPQPQYNVPPQQPQVYYAPPNQQGGYTAPYTYQQPQPMNNAYMPAQPQMSKRESFIGINLLSKIGVIFIIIGVIAFSAVSEDFLAPGIRTVIIFALGIVMTALGEVFYRTSSVIFARALTIGGIAELAVSILIGYHGYGSINELFSLIIGVILAAGAVLLSIRYNSQTIMAVTAVCGFIPCFATLNAELPMYASLVYFILLQTAIVMICGKKSWYIAPFFMIAGNLITAICVYIATDELLDATAAGLIATVYIVASTLVPAVNALIISFRNGGALHAYEAASFISSSVIQLLLSLIFLALIDSVTAFGFLAMFVGLAYLAISVVAKTTFDNCPLLTVLLNSTMICLSCTILTLLPEMLIYVVFHIYAAALYIIGSIKDIKLVRVWGIVTCSISEYIFVNFCLFNLAEDIFFLQFGANALIWLIIMTIQAMRKKRNAGITAFSIAAISNAVVYCLYLVLRLIILFEDEAILDTFGECMAIFMLFSAFVWMIAAFVTGKLKFLGKAAPVTSIVFYGMSLCGLGITNLISCFASPSENILCLVTSIIVNAISVAAVWDITHSISALSPKFAGTMGLIVAIYALFCVTFTLGANDIVAFTNCIISIVYLVASLIWIIWGFMRRNAALRRFGLALALLASAKLFLLDFMGIGAVGRTLMFIIFGIVLLAVSFIYAIFESKLKKQTQEELMRQQQLQYQQQMALYQQQMALYQQQMQQYQQQQMVYNNSISNQNNDQQ